MPFVAVDVKNTRTIVDQAFSVPKCVRLMRICKMFSAVSERTKDELESILGKKFMVYASGTQNSNEKLLSLQLKLKRKHLVES